MAVGMTHLTLIRHGQARAGVDGIVGGPTGDTGLTETGRRQAEALRDRLLDTGFHVDVVLTSVLPRAIETAEILRPAFDGIEPIADCEFCELHPGEADGLTWAEYRERYGVSSPRPPSERFAPGGESLVELDARAARAVADVVARFPEQKVVIVTHGGFISAVCLHLLGYAMAGDRPFFLDPENTSLTTWSTVDEAARLWRFDRYNDAAHLEALR
jgi:broad specificity phosphatase PhoE